MIVLLLSLFAIVCAAVPAVMFCVNLPQFRIGSPADQFCIENAADTAANRPEISVLIPARDEASVIRRTVQAALASDMVAVEVVVLDDHSSDSTGEIVHQISQHDSRVRCIAGKPLPPGWNGKQHACAQLATAAQFQRLAFLDADVQLKPAALAVLARRQIATRADLLSAFPHQQTETVLEKWLIPMMHYILLGFLPIARMRASRHPAYAAGCGQLFLTNKQSYEAAGTHAAIRGSRHDGVKLPRAYRKAGLMTDLIDGTDLAECRMYTSAGEVVRGVLKNATEGIANPRVILPFTVLLLGGTLVPVLTLAWATWQQRPVAASVSLLAVVVSHLPRVLAAKAFRQSWLGAASHLIATPVFVMLQWVALVNQTCGRQIAWRGRVEIPES